jgi:hypothetical protein
MPIIYREFPPEIAESIANARAIHKLAWELGPEQSSLNTPRMHTFSGFLSLLFEHHDSTLRLLETGSNDGSAFALLRVNVETFYRGLWIYLVANDDQIQQMRDGDLKFPPFLEMTQAVTNG